MPGGVQSSVSPVCGGSGGQWPGGGRPDGTLLPGSSITMTRLTTMMAPLALLVLLVLGQGETTGRHRASFGEHRGRNGTLGAERGERQRDDRHSDERQRVERQGERRHTVRERSQRERANRNARKVIFNNLDKVSANQSQGVFNSERWSAGWRVKRTILGGELGEAANSSLELPRQGRKSRERKSCTGKTGMSFSRWARGLVDGHDESLQVPARLHYPGFPGLPGSAAQGPRHGPQHREERGGPAGGWLRPHCLSVIKEINHSTLFI